MLVDPESVKKIDHLTVIFTHLGSAHVKAVRIHVGELTPGVLVSAVLNICGEKVTFIFSLL